MNKTASLLLPTLPLLLVALVSLAAAGCGGSDADLASVRGTVTLDGEPLAGARVEFDPVPEEMVRGKSTGSASYGLTDSSGRYTLQYTPEQEGALIGKHVVRITTRRMTVDADGKEILVPERLPPKFHRESELTREVTPGSNTFDFPLTLESASGAEQ